MTTKSLHPSPDDLNPEVVSAILALRHVNHTEAGRVLGVHSSQVGRRLKGALGRHATPTVRIYRAATPGWATLDGLTAETIPMDDIEATLTL